jgi:predicted metal-dependent phosphoesterase TrpH
MRIDAHCHTDCSDGNITIEDRIEMVKRYGYEAATITDHDFISTEQVNRARQACGETPYIPGIELSLAYANRVVHILGYFVAPEESALENHQNKVQTRDREVTSKLLGYFRDRGANFTIEDLEATSLHTFYSLRLVKRLARDLFENKPPRTLAAFTEAMKDLDLEYVDFAPWSVREGIDLIHQAGGIAVLAHPGGEDDKAMRALKFLNHNQDVIQTYCDWGLDGVEVFTPTHTPREKEKFRQIAEELGLLITAGSDCHGDDPFLGPALMGTMTDIPVNLYENLVACHQKCNP